MNYIDWVERVATTFARMEKRRQASVRALMADVGAHQAQGADEHELEMAVWNAVEDLDAIRVLNALNQIQILETENTRRIRAGAQLSTAWPDFFETFLEDDQRAFLNALVRLAVVERDHYAAVHWPNAAEVFDALGWSTNEREDIGRAHDIVNILEQAGLVRGRVAMGSIMAVRARPTYRGVVYATQQVATEWQKRLDEMAEEWETTTVEHKVQLELNSPTQRGEFVKDVIGLATTKASGRDRYMVIGFDDKTRAFTRSVDSAISQDRLEQILNEYTEPTPEIRFLTVPIRDGGEAGVIQIRREPAKIPYRVRRDVGRIHAGEVFVRHGSQTESPTVRERDALEAEGERARAGN